MLCFEKSKSKRKVIDQECRIVYQVIKIKLIMFFNSLCITGEEQHLQDLFLLFREPSLEVEKLI